MLAKVKYCSAKDVILVDAEGRFDLGKSLVVLRNIVSHPEYKEAYEILFDLRDIDCAFSVANIYKLAELMAFPDPLLPTRKKIAVVVSEDKNFDHAKFFEVCALNRGMQVMSFQAIEEAESWLQAAL